MPVDEAGLSSGQPPSMCLARLYTPLHSSLGLYVYPPFSFLKFASSTARKHNRNGPTRLAAPPSASPNIGTLFCCRVFHPTPGPCSHEVRELEIVWSLISSEVCTGLVHISQSTSYEMPLTRSLANVKHYFVLRAHPEPVQFDRCAQGARYGVHHALICRIARACITIVLIMFRVRVMNM